LKSIRNYSPLTPRTTLNLPTISGLHHQIDAIVREGSSIYHLIECKFTQNADIEELYALNSKLIDYTLAARKKGQKQQFFGYFLAGRVGVNDNFYQYAISWGISLIVPHGLPPLSYMLHQSNPESILHSKIEKLMNSASGTDLNRILAERTGADQLLFQWQSISQLWVSEQNDSKSL
jgi:hypothetical protein